MLKKRRPVILILSILFCLFTVLGCSSSPAGSPKYADNPVAGRETLMQVSTINALMAGVYDGIISCGQIRGYGDFGIGTFDKLDGEMIVLDGDVYQVRADGIAYTVSDTVSTPFAAVTYFDTDLQQKLVAGMNLTEFQKYLDGIVPTANIFYAIKIEGTFSYVKTRSVPPQNKPYPVLAEVTQKQSVFEFNNVSGTIVGFKCPQYVNGVNVPGYHLHFLTADRKAGGHVLEFTLQAANASIDKTPNFLMLLPDERSDFYKIDLTGDKQKELDKAEK